MEDSHAHPVQALGLHIAHVGINAGSVEEARQIAPDLFRTYGSRASRNADFCIQWYAY